MAPSFTTVSDEARRILSVLAQENPALKISEDYIRDYVTFEGNDLPMLPGGLKSDALSSASFAAFGAVADQIARQRYGGEPSNIKVNTKHATFFLASPALFSVNGKAGGDKDHPAPNWEEDGMWGPPMHSAATRIYETKDNRWFQLHGDLNASFLLKDIGLEDKRDISLEEAQKIVAAWVKQYTADELEAMMFEQRHSGSKCYKPDEWLATDMGKALAARPICDVRELTPPTHVPVPYPPSKANRILEGIKVVEMVRVIAGPTIGRTLAELGAQVIKVNPPHLRDITMLQYTLTAGKHTTALDARDPEQKAKLEHLVSQADVFINGFRPNSLERLGFGKQRVLELVKQARGDDASIVYVDESAYGPEGPYSGRPGWQQIGDTASGASYVQGRTLGLDNNEECVLPPLPISDLVTGVLGATSVLCALRDRAEQGGSYYVSACLTKYDMVSVAMGTYPEDVVKKVAQEYDFGSMRSIDNVSDLLFKVIKGWMPKHAQELDAQGDSPFFVEFQEGPLGKMRILKPVAQIEKYPSKWDHPPRPYGNDEPTFAY